MDFANDRYYGISGICVFIGKTVVGNRNSNRSSFVRFLNGDKKNFGGSRLGCNVGSACCCITNTFMSDFAVGAVPSNILTARIVIFPTQDLKTCIICSVFVQLSVQSISLTKIIHNTHALF